MSAILSLLLSLAVPAAGSVAAPPAVAGPPVEAAPAPVLTRGEDDDEDSKPDKRPEVKALIEQLKTHAKDTKAERDEEGIAVVDELLQEFPESGPKDRESIADAVADAVTFKRRPGEDEAPREALKLAAATALGRMGPESGKLLIKLVDHKSLRDPVKTHAAVLKSLGRVAPEKGVKPLLDMLESHVDELTAAAATGLAGYAEAEQKVRKEIFEDVLQVVIPLEELLDNADNGSGEYEEARDRYDAVSAPARDALQAMASVELRDFFELRTWWNNNKKKDWDALRTAG